MTIFVTIFVEGAFGAQLGEVPTFALIDSRSSVTDFPMCHHFNRRRATDSKRVLTKSEPTVVVLSVYREGLWSLVVT